MRARIDRFSPFAIYCDGGDFLGNRIAYIGKSRKKKGASLRFRLLFPFLLFLLVFFLLNTYFTPILTDLASVAVENVVEGVINEAVASALSKNHVLFSDLVRLSYKEDGSVSALQADTKRLVALRTALLRTVLSALTEEGALTVLIPYSSLLGLNLFPSDKAFPVSIRLTKGVNAYFTGEFLERGINQTLHRISFTVSVTVLLMVPQKNRQTTVTRLFPMTETVLLGTVPDAYTKIHRLTDDITESELDDIYDFGADNYIG